MKALAAALSLAAVVVAGCGTDSAADSGSVSVEVVYLDHSPVRAALGDIDKVLEKYDDGIAVKRLNAEAEDGKAVAERVGETGHVAILLVIDGKVESQVDGQKVRFVGFPEGTSPMKSAEGEWTLDQLDKALAEVVARK